MQRGYSQGLTLCRHGRHSSNRFESRWLAFSSRQVREHLSSRRQRCPVFTNKWEKLDKWVMQATAKAETRVATVSAAGLDPGMSSLRRKLCVVFAESDFTGA